jgi:hypothetical protein
MSRASLIDAYISGLSLTAVSVVASADGRRCRIETGGEIAPGRGTPITSNGLSRCRPCGKSRRRAGRFENGNRTVVLRPCCVE